MSRVGIAAALVGLLALATLAHAGVEADVGPLDDRLTHPDVPIDGVARNFGVWNPDYEAGGAIRYEALEFRKNGYRGLVYTQCFGEAHYHPQHVVRLPNKNGRAYFAVSNSFGDVTTPPFTDWRDPSGTVHFFRTDSVVDPVTDLVVNNSGSDGEIYREEWYHPGSTIGDWNHPGKMQVIGGLLLVSAEQWTGSFALFCGDYAEGSAQDAVLFYDVRDPENPKYWGKITAGELGVSGSVNDATLIRAGASWILTVQGRMFSATEVMPDIANWTFIGSAGGHGFAETHGDAFYSYEEYDLPATPPVPWGGGAVPSLGERRAIYFDATEDPSENGGYVSGDERLDFNNICFGPTSGPCNFAPTTNPTTAAKGFASYRSAPNVWGGVKDYDATGIYVSGGAPIVYAPLVNYADNSFDKIFQIHHPENLYETVAEAMNDTSRVWRTGGNGGWFAQFSPTHDGVSSAQSSNIADNQATYLETTVEGAGTLTFWWKVSSEAGWDFLRFELDGVQQASAPQIAGEVDWQQRTVVISTAGTHTLRWTYAKDVIVSAGSDAAWLDQVAFNISIPEAVDQPSGFWTTGGSGLFGGAPFFGQNTTTHDGQDAARSGNIFSNSSSWMETTVQGPGTLTFWWIVSSEAGFDFLRFTRNGVQPAEAPRISGSVAWQQRTVPIPAGFHALRWTYEKDFITTAGADAGWVDQVVYTPSPTIVSNTGDNDEVGSLRRLINDLPAGSTVTFDPQALNGATIVLNGSLSISKNFTLDASALPNGLTIRVAGGPQALYVGAGTVNVNDITFAGSIGPTDGYAIYNAATFNCTRCTLAGNIGGLVNIATATLTNSTVVGNIGGDYGGGLLNVGTLRLIHSTVSGNGADVAGGGLHNEGTLQIENSIVAANSAPSGPDISNLGGGIVPDGANLIGDNDTVAVAFPANALHGTPASPLDPLLRPLFNYGGRTQTRPPRVGSAALDAALVTPSTPATDQRGLARPSGAAGDLGAAEVSRVLVTNAADAGPGSLRDAVAVSASSSVIAFAAGLSGGTIALTTGQVYLDKDLAIDASALPAGVTLSGSGVSRILGIYPGVDVELVGLTFADGNGAPGGYGGAIWTDGVTRIRNSTFTDNDGVIGGAIFNGATGDLRISNSTLAGNAATFSGGALANDHALMTLIHTTVSDNSCVYDGCGIYNPGGELWLENSIVAGNLGSYVGGGRDIGNHEGGIVYPLLANLIGSNDTVSSQFPAGPRVGTDASPLAPGLASLGNYGGPTRTRPPLLGSPAIDAAVEGPETPPTDQRGFARPVGPAGDLGAVEFGCDIGSDADCDGIDNVADNCPALPNADQLDRGGLLTSTPNGRGDLCECGDVTDDGVVDASDVTLYREVLSDPAVTFSDAASIKCLVFDNDADQSCNLLDVSVLRRAIDGLLPDIPTTCIANVE